MTTLGSLQQVWKYPHIYQTVDNAKVIPVQQKSGQFRYKYECKRNAALIRFDIPMRSGNWVGYTPRQMFAHCRSPAFKKGCRNFVSNCKKYKSRGMCSKKSYAVT